MYRAPSLKIPFVSIDEIIDQEDVKKKCDVYGDSVSKMTPSRLFSRFMSRFRFYNPRGKSNANDNNDDLHSSSSQQPSLDAAWAYYENVTLARIYADSDVTTRAQVGDITRPTKLYPYWSTSLHDLKAFGIGVRMYFSTLLVLAAFLAGAGLLNIPLITYLWNYAPNTGKDGISFLIRGSAICDSSEWVECDSCNQEYSNNYPAYRLDGEYVLKNTCNFEDWMFPGILSWVASIILIFAFLIAFFWVQRKAEIVFDEEIQTTSDYSIKVVNPPGDALDPEEWRNYFSSFADKGVASVTIAIDNSDLLRALIRRRRILSSLKSMLPYGSDLMDASVIEKASNKISFKLLPFLPNPMKKYLQVQALNKMVVKLVNERNYKAVNVFVIFQTQRGQRNALHCLTTGILDRKRNRINTSKFDGKKIAVRENSKKMSVRNLSDAIQNVESEEITIKLNISSAAADLPFRGSKVLNISEAGEPSNIRWMDLEVPFSVRFVKAILSILVLMFFVAWSGVFVYGISRHRDISYTTIYISVTNIIIPKICELINSFESHSTEGKRQESLYVKMALFRCFNSGIALLVVFNFIQTISIQDGNESEEHGLMSSVFSVIFAEMFTIPIIKLLDIMNNVRKHILAPRARDQEEMNSYMVGGKFELAERYTDATKVLFVALFYSSLMPTSLFLGALALLIHFLFGKFCLLRMWRRGPDVGFRLARLSRNAFFSTSLIAHLLMGTYFWSGYPYDNVCGSDENGYAYCNQDIFRELFTLSSKRGDYEWMTSSQELIVFLYGWSTVALLIIAFIVIMKEVVLPLLNSLYESTYEPNGQDQFIDFNDVKQNDEVTCYLPQLRENGFEYPLIVADIASLDKDLIGWRDILHDYKRHNLLHDVEEIIGEIPKGKPIFSIVQQWPKSV